jgi:hypothetical protein
MPPYEGRQTQAKEGLDEHMDKVFHRVDEVPPGPGREISDAEREGVSSTDMDATSALRVDESIGRRRGRRQAHQITQGGARQSPAKLPRHPPSATDPEIAELDCNPIKVLPDRVVVVDARIRVEAASLPLPLAGRRR